MERWRKRGIDVRLTVDAAAPGWKEAVGPVTVLIPRIEFDPSRAVAFIVGPEIMMRFVVQAWLSAAFLWTGSLFRWSAT